MSLSLFHNCQKSADGLEMYAPSSAFIKKKFPFILQYCTNVLYGLTATFIDFTEHIQSLSTFCLLLCFICVAFFQFFLTLTYFSRFVSFFFLLHYLLIHLSSPTLYFISYLTLWAILSMFSSTCQFCLNSSRLLTLSDSFQL